MQRKLVKRWMSGTVAVMVAFSLTGAAGLPVYAEDSTTSSEEAADEDYSWYYDDTDAVAYTISDAGELEALADLVNSDVDDFADKTVTLAADVSLSGIEWEPIGTADTAFAGTFDGDGYTISDMEINSSDGYCGLFGNVSGTICDLTVTGEITNTSSDTDYVGGVCGKLSAGGLISGVTADVEITAYVSSSEGCYNVGGVVGMVGEPGTSLYTDEDAAVVEQCVNLGSVAGYVRVGGIAGRSAGIVRECANFGSVYNASGSKKGTGGIVGMNGVNGTATDGGLVENCYNAGYVDGNSGYWTGGIVGFQNSLSVTQYCYNSSDLGIYKSEGVAWSWSNPGIGQNEGTATSVYGIDSVVGSDPDTTVGNSGGTVTDCIYVSSEDMQSSDFVAALNGEDGTAWTADAADEADQVNSGYPILSFQAAADEEVSYILYGGETITAGGTYQLAEETTTGGVITIATTDAVVIVGNGADFDESGTVTSEANANLFFDASATAGIDLTFEDVYISNTSASMPLLDLTGDGNTISFEGVNVLDQNVGYNDYAAIHVGLGTSATISGSGVLYLYKSSQGAGVGGNSAEMNGEITFAMTGSAFMKGTRQGAVIGAGASASSTDDAPGEVIFKSGTYNLVSVSRGAVIGGSAGDEGGSTGTTVRIEGGLININVDYSGAAVGGGGYDGGNDASGGTMYVDGGSLRVYIDKNAADNATTGWQGKTFTEGVNDAAITAQRLNSDGDEVAWLQFDTTLLSDSADYYTVKIDGETFYEGSAYEYYYIQEALDKSEQYELTSTPSNWVTMTDENNDSNLYFWVATGMQTDEETEERTGEAATHEVEVNGETFVYVWDDDAEAFVLDESGEDDSVTADSLAVRRGNTFYFTDSIEDAETVLSFQYGKSDDEVLIGDWDGDG
ncbi:MAG: hypothetical protein LUF32_06400, partial [Clostridiales bacterium]|nr:hypothetical protein [Clostridiales bacterium]